MEPTEITIKGYTVLEKIVTKTGNTGNIYLPKAWIGKPVKVILLEDIPIKSRK